MSRYAHPAGSRHAEVLPEENPPLPPEDLNTLDPRVWPATAHRSDGEVTIGGVGVRALAAEYGTPLFVMDEEDFRTEPATTPPPSPTPTSTTRARPC